VVLNALRTGGVEGVERYLAGLDARQYNPFNLLYGNAELLRVDLKQELLGLKLSQAQLATLSRETPGLEALVSR